MHDVAMDAMGKECATKATEQRKSEDFPRSSRHLLLSINEPETFLNASLEKSSPVIQTLIKGGSTSRFMLGFELWSKQVSFLKPRCLHRLRYLDLSNSDIKSLPEDISILYNLQTLNLSYCENLEELPKGMKHMTALRHLYLHGCEELKSMPSDLRRLTSLQTLTCFSAGNGSGCSKVGELGRLDDLGGGLELRQLENVKEIDAKVAKLGNMKKLARLTLRWTESDKETHNSDKEVLEGLEPHNGLKVLRIYSYSGRNCPTWMDNLKGIVEIELCACKKLEKLPAVWQLPSLKVLCLQKLTNFETWCEVQGQKPRFPVLEKLLIRECESLTALPKVTFPELREMSLSDMAMFERWEAGEESLEEHVIFPQLEKLSISFCKSLAAFPRASVISPPFGGAETECRSAFPALRELKLVVLKTLERWEAGEGTPRKDLTFHRLEKLTIIDCPELTTLPEAPKLSVFKVGGVSQQLLSIHAARRYIASLSRLELLVDDAETESVVEQTSSELVHGKDKWGSSKSPLTSMKLYGCSHLFSHSSALALWICFGQLLDLTIWGCVALVYWPENVFRSLLSLRTLRIDSCSQLTGYTEEASEQSEAERNGILPCLESLEIDNCVSLVDIPKPPASLKTLHISRFSNNLESIVFGQQEDTPSLVSGSSSAARAATSVLKLSSSVNHGSFPCLESLTIWSCPGLLEVANLPPSIKTLEIRWCSNLRSLSGQLDAIQTLWIDLRIKLKSLESFLGSLPSLEALYLNDCNGLESLPNGSQAYSSLRDLTIQNCPGIKLLPPSLQQRLDHLKKKNLDGRYEERKGAMRRLVCLK